MKFSNITLITKLKGRIFRPFFCGLFLCHSVQLSAIAESQFNIDFESVIFSEITSIRSLSGSWNEPISKGNEAFSQSRLDIYQQIDDYRIGYRLQADAYYKFSPETVELLYLTNNKLDLPENETFEIYLQPQRFSRQGILFSYNFKLANNLQIEPTFSLLKPTKLIIGDISGRANTVSINDYDFEFDSDLTFSSDPLYQRKTNSLKGYGYSLDLKIDYNIDEDWKITFLIYDLSGFLQINNAPHTTATSNSSTKEFDENGYIVYQPVTSGIEGYQDIRLSLMSNNHLMLTHSFSNEHKVIWKYHHYENAQYSEFIWSTQKNSTAYQGIWIPETDAIGFKVVSKNFVFSFVSDDLNYNKMKFIAVSGSINIEF